MDKINLANWNDVFERTEQEVLFASERYTDFRFSFEEEGLAKGFVQSVITPGMQLTDFCIHAPRPIQLVEEDMKETAESVFVLDGVFTTCHLPCSSIKTATTSNTIASLEAAM